MAAYSVASPLSNTGTAVEAVESVSPDVNTTGDLLANLYCNPTINTDACSLYCSCECVGLKMFCFEQPSLCPRLTLAACIGNCGCAA